MTSIRNIYILCGGKSIRMGRDKYGLMIHGKTFLENLVDRAAGHFKEVVLLGAGHHLDAGCRQIPDAAEDIGPLGGLLAALNDSEEDSIAIVPVDLPLVSSSTFNKLGEELLKDGSTVAKVAQNKERIQPLVGVYRTLIVPELEEYLQAEKRSVLGFIKRINIETFRVKSEEMTNINSPEEYEKLLKSVK